MVKLTLVSSTDLLKLMRRSTSEKLMLGGIVLLTSNEIMQLLARHLHNGDELPESIASALRLFDAAGVALLSIGIVLFLAARVGNTWARWRIGAAADSGRKESLESPVVLEDTAIEPERKERVRSRGRRGSRRS